MSSSLDVDDSLAQFGNKSRLSSSHPTQPFRFATRGGKPIRQEPTRCGHAERVRQRTQPAVPLLASATQADPWLFRSNLPCRVTLSATLGGTDSIAS